MALVLVTGAATGLGLATAQALACAGHDVVAHARNPSRLAEADLFDQVRGAIYGNLADYLVPVNADVPELRAIYLEGADPQADPLGVKGVGEVVHVGVAPAIANAVFHATGKRIRSLPITAESLL